MLCAFFFVYFYLYIRRRTGREGLLAGYRKEVDSLIAEIDRATDRDARLVEERIAALRKMLEEADRRIALLSRDLERRRAGAELYNALGKKPAPVEKPPASVAEALPAGLPAPPKPDGGPARPLTEQAAELSRQGFAAELIASRLGVSLSEVELALAVSRRRDA